jgi:hypothetical protein
MHECRDSAHALDEVMRWEERLTDSLEQRICPE